MVIKQNIRLAPLLYYRIGGEAKYLLEIEDKKDINQALDFIKSNHISKVVPIGIGSNILFSDSFFDGAVLRFIKPRKKQITKTQDGLVECFASHLLDDLIWFAFDNHLKGIEWAGGLPSTVGAAIRGNVGAFGKDIAGCVEKVDSVDMEEGLFKTLTHHDLHFSYRNSIIKKQKNCIVITGYFHFEKATKKENEEIKQEYYDHISYRQKNHPVEYPSCGSVFKNITKKDDIAKIVSTWPQIQKQIDLRWHGKVSIGYVIHTLGFSGFKIGGAQVSEKHANYIINKKNATFLDVLGIIENIKQKFYDTFGFYPEPEVEIINY